MNENFGLFLVRFFQPKQWKATLIFIYATALVVYWIHLPQIPSIENAPPECWSTFWWGERKVFLAFLLMGVFPAFLVKVVFREKLVDYGIGLGNRLFTFRSALLMTPFAFGISWISASPEFLSVYPMNPCARWGGIWFGTELVLYALLYYTAYEFFFRGFLLHGLMDSCGMRNAVWIQVIVSTFLHFGHPPCEIIGAFCSSVIWGFLFLRTRSIVSNWFQHSAVGIATNWALELSR